MTKPIKAWMWKQSSGEVSVHDITPCEPIPSELYGPPFNRGYVPVEIREIKRKKGKK